MSEKTANIFHVNSFLLFHLRARIQQGCLFSPFLFSIKEQILTSAIRQEKEGTYRMEMK
jgi:hypothetical protein